MGKHERIPASSRERVAQHRAALRAQGLRPRLFWLPDVRDPAFKAELRAQAGRLAAHDRASGDAAWFDALAEGALADLPPHPERGAD